VNGKFLAMFSIICICMCTRELQWYEGYLGFEMNGFILILGFIFNFQDLFFNHQDLF